MKPNILFYFTDQQRADTCGCFGQPLSITPYLDQLAREGVQFNQAYTPQPVCGPCRAMFQTGKYPTEIGCFRNNIMLPSDVKTVANYMEEAGYETAYIGKWHLASNGGYGLQPEIDNATKPVPKELRGGYNGFWRASDVLEFTSHGYDGYVYDENNERIDFTGYRTDCITDMALDFFDTRNPEKPFFMTISHIEPHHQNDRMHYEGPEGSKEQYQNYTLPKDLEILGGDAKQEYPDYLGACASLDKNLGKLIHKLKEKGLYDNTILIFASDHGSHFKTRNRDAHVYGGDDYKRTCHASATRVPLVIAGGAYKGGKQVDALVSTASLPKTMLAMAEIDVGADMAGENLLDVVEGNVPERKNEVFIQISESRVGRAIRTPDYCYAVYAPNKDGNLYSASDVYADDFLYDLKKDPYELNNVVENDFYKEIKSKLQTQLLDWIEKVEGNRPTILNV